MFVDRILSLQQRVLGHPFVFERIRPLLVGGIDFSPLYTQIRRKDAVILDVGCGTGAALHYLDEFASYVGMDIDPVAVAHASARYASSKVSFSSQICTPEDVRRVAPTDVVLAGVLHHLTDSEAIGLLASLRESSRLAQILTVDIVFLPGHPVGNLLAHLDRGRYCRTEEGYRNLVAESGLSVRSSLITRSRPRTGLAKYLYLTLGP